MKKCKFCDSGIDGSSSSGRKYYGKQLESIEFCSNKCAICATLCGRCVEKRRWYALCNFSGTYEMLFGKSVPPFDFGVL